MTLVGEGRTVVVDEGGSSSPVSVCYPHESRPTLQVYPRRTTGVDPIERICRGFAALAAGEAAGPDVSVVDVSAATAVTEAVRRSVSVGGVPVPVQEPSSDHGRAPALRVIKGRGRSGTRSERAAQLRLVSS
jgi:hypothetical protein